MDPVITGLVFRSRFHFNTGGFGIYEGGGVELVHQHGLGGVSLPPQLARVGAPCADAPKRRFWSGSPPATCLGRDPGRCCGHRWTRLSRVKVKALFSLFETAMLSASQDDITLRASYWFPGTERPHLKRQRQRLLLQRPIGSMTGQTGRARSGFCWARCTDHLKWISVPLLPCPMNLPRVT